MTEARRDANSVATLLGVSNVDGLTPVLVYIDPVTHRILVDAAVSISSIQIAGNSTYADGSKNVTTAGTRVQLSNSSVPCKKVYIQALTGNGGVIYVGGSTIAAGRGTALFATSSIELTVSDLNLVYLDASVSGEGVSYSYEN